MFVFTPDGRARRVKVLGPRDMEADLRFANRYGRPVTVSARDGSTSNGRQGSRLTNLVGIEGGRFMKRCPKCGQAKTEDAFGPAGRRASDVRDQSQCSACRPHPGGARATRTATSRKSH